MVIVVYVYVAEYTVLCYSDGGINSLWYKSVF